MPSQQPPLMAAGTVKTAEQALRESTVTRDVEDSIVAVTTKTVAVG